MEKFDRHAWAKKTWEAMKARNPKGCEEVERVVKKRVSCAEVSGAFGKKPTKH